MRLRARTEAGEDLDVLCDDDGRLLLATPSGNPIGVETTRGNPLEVREGSWEADGAPTHTHDITASAVSHATAGAGFYVLKAVDNGCYVRWDGGTCTKTVGGFSYHLSEGEALKIYLPGDSISIINTAAGFLTVLPLF